MNLKVNITVAIVTVRYSVKDVLLLDKEEKVQELFLMSISNYIDRKVVPFLFAFLLVKKLEVLRMEYSATPQ